jgi:hypothetical protein
MHQDKGEEKSNKAKIHQLSLAFISSSSNCNGKVLLSEVKFISNDVLQQKKTLLKVVAGTHFSPYVT